MASGGIAPEAIGNKMLFLLPCPDAEDYCQGQNYDNLPPEYRLCSVGILKRQLCRSASRQERT